MSFLARLIRGRRPATGAEVDRLVVRQLQGRGADLTQPRHVIHFIYFGNESDARSAADTIDGAGYETTVTEPSDEMPEWTVRAEAYRVIGFATVDGFRAWFEQISAEHNGEYDGWEAAAKP
jgi:Regulator of ribonuclease activity B